MHSVEKGHLLTTSNVVSQEQSEGSARRPSFKMYTNPFNTDIELGVIETKKPLLEKFPTAEALETFINDRILSIAQDDDQTDNESSGAHMVENEIMLPREWEMHKDENTGELYYINSRTQERTKEKPGQ